MTKLISIFVILVVLFCGWKLVGYYQKVTEENEKQAKQESGADFRPENLTGMNWNLQPSLEAATKNGGTAMRDWLKTFGGQIQDPKKAWVEMDCSLALLRTDPNDAKRIFKGVKDRTATNSPIYFRVRQLEKTFE
ncbi:MAG: hypothetical protein RLY20_3556 [Verrucomicrobiota bacterium]|jgi:hypothetical protein